MPEYICSRYKDQLEPDALALYGKYDVKTLQAWEFESKIYELIRSEYSTPDGFKANFILGCPYYFSHEDGLFFSQMNSLFENLYNISLYKFPDFFSVLNNQLEFNGVIYNLLSKYAPRSMGIHERLNLRRPGYTFHTLTHTELNLIVKEAYQIYWKVQKFLQNLSPDQKNFFAICEEEYGLANSKYKQTQIYTLASKIFQNSVQVYRTKYGKEYPEVSFNDI